MQCEEFAVDMRDPASYDAELLSRQADLIHEFNSTRPSSPEHSAALEELLGDRLGEGSIVNSPINLVAPEHLRIGRNVYINGNFLGMCRGGITIEDDAMIAANVSILSNNHDLYERAILLCKPVLVCKGAWIGAGAMILPGVRIGRYAVVGAGAVVTKDVEDYGIAVGNPARTIRVLDGSRFPQDRPARSETDSTETIYLPFHGRIMV